MTVQRLVVFSGFHTKFVEKAKEQLLAKQAQVVFAKTDLLQDQYFERLLTRTLDTIRQASLKHFRVVGILASCGPEHDAERQAFFPALRRLAFPERYRKDINRVAEVVDVITKRFLSPEFQKTYQYIRSNAHGILCLPIRNTPSGKLVTEINRVYSMEAMEPSSSLDKEVVRRRGGAWRVRNFDFRPAINSHSHPIRRCTDSVVCDVMAGLRLGFSIPDRFEFDVTCEDGLNGKQFKLCDGARESVPHWATHLNMRINDDFRSAR